MKKDTLKKKIDCTRDYFNRLWSALIFTITGTIAVSFYPNSVYKFFLLSAGIFLIALCIKGCKGKSELLNKLLQELEKEN